MKKAVIFVIIIVIVAGGVYFYTKQAKAPAQTTEMQNQTTPSPKQTSATPTPTGAQGGGSSSALPPTQSGGGENSGSNVQVTEVDFDGTNYSPNPVTINVSDYIFFENKSTGDFWPLAGSAATMAAYPSFSAGKPIAAGGEYKFQFTKAGSFSYGDNLHPNAAASIIVNP
jgi:plastocyanin